jgi:amino acid transporter
MLMLVAAWQLRRKLPDAPRSFRIPGGRLGLAAAIVFPALFCGVKIYYSEPYVFRYSPWLLAAGPVAYFILHRVLRREAADMQFANASESKREGN